MKCGTNNTERHVNEREKRRGGPEDGRKMGRRKILFRKLTVAV